SRGGRVKSVSHLFQRRRRNVDTGQNAYLNALDQRKRWSDTVGISCPLQQRPCAIQFVRGGERGNQNRPNRPSTLCQWFVTGIRVQWPPQIARPCVSAVC